MSSEIFGAVNIEFCEYSFKNSIFIIIRQIGYIGNLSAVNFFIIVFVKGYIKSFQVVPTCKPCIVVIIALFYLAQFFEAEKAYSEQEVNLLLYQHHTFFDPATLRRELYDFHFLDRSADGRVYTLSSPQPTMESFSL